MRIGQILSVGSLGLLGLFGGCLILAHDGFTSSHKRSNVEVFVPAPQAYVMAAIMFALSVLALVWVLQQARARKPTWALAALLYLLVARWLTGLLAAWWP